MEVVPSYEATQTVHQKRVTEDGSPMPNTSSGGSGAPATETVARTMAPSSTGALAYEKRRMFNTSKSESGHVSERG